MKRYIQSPEPPYELIDAAEFSVPSSTQRGDGALWGDRHYEGLRATDGADIGSRSKQRAYMAEKGLCTHDDYKDHFAKAAQQRARYYERGGTVTKHDIARAIHQLGK